MNDIKARIEELKKIIAKHDFHYYVQAAPIISDSEYDKLLHELKSLEEAHPELITPDSPTQRVGHPIVSFASEPHRVPMLSLDNTYSINDIKDWINRIQKIAGNRIFPIVAEMKIDGVSASIRYNNGTFVSALTRGDGKVGEIVTANVKTIRCLPLRIASNFDMDLRGEVYVPKSVLRKLNLKQVEKGEEPFKNCRNLAAGTLKSLDPKIAAERGLRIMVYGIAQARELGFYRHSDVLQFLQEQKFPVNQPYRVCQNLEEIENYLKEIECCKENLDFDIDGVVLKVDDLTVQIELGATAKAPRWAVAFKFSQEQALTRVRSVIWQVGRAQMTPVAILDPVELGGTTVSRASLHNLDQIREKDIRIGDLVRIEKAGYIIPYVIEAVHSERNGTEVEIKPPDYCPSCGEKTSLESNAGTSIVRCLNKDCRGVLSRRIRHFVTQMGIENIGPQLIDRLIAAGFISEIPDLYQLKKEDLLQVDRMGSKSAEKILANIANSQTAPLTRVISALGIPNIGTVAAEDLAKKYRSLKALRNASLDELQTMYGIGEKVATSIIEFFNDSKNIDWLNKLEKILNPTDPFLNQIGEKNKFSGKIFVITGEGVIPRREIEEIIKKNGGQVSSSVSPKTSFLILGSLEPPDYSSTKKKRAIELGIPIISEIELQKML